MKRCRKCNFQSDAMLNYCWQCGAPTADAGHFYQGAPPTQNYNAPSQPTPTFHGGGRNYQPGFQPHFQPRRASFSWGRFAAVLGGFFFVLTLLAGAGAAVVIRLVNEQRDCCAPNPQYRSRQPAPVNAPKPTENPVSDQRRSDKASTRFEKIWVDYNVRENNRPGMRIHVRFAVYNMKNVDSRLTVSFEKADGTQLTTGNGKFANKDGQVAVSRALKPGFDETVYKDLDVFMPYDELKLGHGRYDLKMDADIADANGELLEHLGYHDFQYEKK